MRIVYWVATAGLLAAAYAETLVWMAGRWAEDPYYSHGFFIPLVSLALLWGRRGTPAAHPPSRPIWLGVSLAAAALHLLGLRLAFFFLSGVSLVGMLFGLAMMLGGGALARAAAFPLAYLLFAVPLPMIVVQQASLPMQELSSACAGAVLRGMGAPVQRAGVHLEFPAFTLAIEDACSGLRSLITVLALGLLVAHLAPVSRRRKALVVAIAPLLALGANVVRIVTGGLVGLAFGGPAALMFFDRFSGLLFFALVALGVLAVAGRMTGPPPAGPDVPPPPAAPPVPVPPASGLSARQAVPFLLVLALAAGGAAAWSPRRTAPLTPRLAGWTPAVQGWEAGPVSTLTGFPGEEGVSLVLRREGAPPAAVAVRRSVNARYLHSPEVCATAAGWQPRRRERRVLATEEGAPIVVNLWSLRRGGESVSLAYWFMTDGAPAAGSLDQHVRTLWARLARGVSESLYMEISVRVPLGQEAEADAEALGLVPRVHREAVGRAGGGRRP